MPLGAWRRRLVSTTWSIGLKAVLIFQDLPAFFLFLLLDVVVVAGELVV